MTGRLRVLVVEDEFLIAMEIEAILQDAGHAVLGPAADVADALGLIERDPPDVAVLDVNLGDGETSVRIAAELAGRRIGYVLSTGYRQQDLEAEYGAGIPVIQKPIDGNRLLEAIAALSPQRAV